VFENYYVLITNLINSMVDGFAASVPIIPNANGWFVIWLKMNKLVIKT
jgi:hypothetical protein